MENDKRDPEQELYINPPTQKPKIGEGIEQLVTEGKSDVCRETKKHIDEECDGGPFCPDNY
jgi:hypothetical protein